MMVMHYHLLNLLKAYLIVKLVDLKGKAVLHFRLLIMRAWWCFVLSLIKEEYFY